MPHLQPLKSRTNAEQVYSRGVPEDYAFYLLPGRGVEGVLALIDHDVPLEYASQLGFAGVGEADAVLALHAAGVTVDYISGLPVSSRDAAGVAQVFTAGVPARYAGALWSRTDPDGLVALHAHGVTEQYAFGLLLSGADAAEVVAMHERGVPEGYAWKMLGEAGSDGVLALHAAGVPEEYAWDDHPAGDWDWANPPPDGYRALLGPTDAAGVLALHAGGVEKDYARGLLPHTDVAGVLALHAGGVPDEYARALLGFTDADGVTALHAEGVTALAAERLLAHGCGVDWIVATHAARGQQARPGARAVPEAQLAAGPPAPEPILVRRAGPAGSGYGF